MGWSEADIPDQAGRTAVVTGATGGVGFEVARALLARGAEVVLASRDAAKGAAAVGRLGALAARARFEPLDLADLASVRGFAQRMAAAERPLDLLVANAGVMSPGPRRLTVDGFERHMGVNHLGHFALAGRLLPLLRRGSAPRLVAVASLTHHAARLAPDDLQGERRHSAMGAYGRSKLADLLFVAEFARRSQAGGWGVAALAAHPGWSRTDLGQSRAGEAPTMTARALGALSSVFAQPATAGALPVLYAATAPQARPGGYYGPGGPGELTGAPGEARRSALAQDTALAGELWARSERLTGVSY